MNTIDLDCWLAENVMGWKIKESWVEGIWEPVYKNGKPVIDSDDVEDVWHPTTNLQQAMECVDKMIADGWTIKLFGNKYEWEVTIISKEFINPKYWVATALELPLAICEAIYKA